MPYTKIVGAKVRSTGTASADTKCPAPKKRNRLAAAPTTSTYPSAHRKIRWALRYCFNASFWAITLEMAEGML